MALFKPNTAVKVSSTKGKHDIYGKPTIVLRWQGLCSIVKMDRQSVKTSVRADTSGSRGSAMETLIEAILLFPANTVIDVDDLVEVAGVKVIVTGVIPKISLAGALDHYRVIATASVA